MMDSKPNGGTTDAADRGFGFTALEGETRSGGGARPPGKKKFNWKAVIGVVVAAVVVWQLFHVLTENTGKSSSASHSPTSGPAALAAAPTPQPPVTLGGHPVAA